MAPMSFLDILPFELRSQIFRYIFESPSGRIRFDIQRRDLNFRPVYRILTAEGKEQVITLSLLKTCRQTHLECRDLLWKYNNVTIGPLYWQGGYFKESRYLFSSAELYFQTDERIFNKVRGVSMLVDFTLDTPYLDKWYIRSPRNLETVFQHLRTWTNLSWLTMHVGYSEDHRRCEFGHEGFMSMIQDRQAMLQKEIDAMPYEGYLQVLKKAGGEDGYLSHLKKRMHISVGRGSFDGFASTPYAFRVIESQSSPDGMLLELNAAFGDGLWINSILHSKKGNLVAPATVPIGRLQKRSWSYITRNGHKHYQRIQGYKGFQYERDLAQLFIALIVAAISTITLPDVLGMMSGQEDIPPYPSNPPERSQLRRAYTYTEKLLKQKGLGSSLKAISMIELEELHQQSTSGVKVTLAAQSDDAYAAKHLDSLTYDDFFEEYYNIPQYNPNAFFNYIIDTEAHWVDEEFWPQIDSDEGLSDMESSLGEVQYWPEVHPVNTP